MQYSSRGHRTRFRPSAVHFAFILSFTLATLPIQTQTILNPDFEQESIGTQNMQTGQIHRCQDWIRASGGDTDPDYFHVDCQVACNNFSADVPQNQRGYAADASLKEAYAGCLTRHVGNGWYEYIRGRVTGLTVGKRYNVQFQVRLGHVSDFAFNGLQACVTELNWLNDPNQPSWTDRLPLQYEAQIRRPPGDWIDDPNHWWLVSGTFVASAAEEFIYIGYFGNINDKTNNIQQLQDCISFTPQEPWTHYYVDELTIAEAVEVMPDCCSSGQIEIETTSTANCCVEVKLTDNNVEGAPTLCRVGGVRVSVDENYLSQFSPPTSRLIRTSSTNLWDATVNEDLAAVTWRFPAHGQHLPAGQPTVMGVFCLNNPLAGAFFIPIVIEILADDGVTVMCRKSILVDCDPV